MDNAVLTPLMLLHWLFSVEFLVANVALKRSIIPMRPLMHLNRNFSHDEIGFSTTSSACTGFRPEKRDYVRTPTYPKISLLSVLFPANFTGKRFFSRVSDQMPLHCGHADESFTTNSAYRQDLGRSFPHT